MTNALSMKWISRSLLDRVGLKGEDRSLEQLREHYELEKTLATRLRESSREERRALYPLLYDELHRQIPALASQSGQSKPSRHMAITASPQWRFVRRFLRNNATFLEIGAGDCAISLEVTKFVKNVYALEVSEEITKHIAGPKNFSLLLFDGCNIPLPSQSVTIAYSHQVMEHLHPDDALEQLTNIYKVLAHQGIYICVTPNRLSGPHDISRRFDTVATGFHLKEYTNSELSSLFKRAGFSKAEAYIGVIGIYWRFPFFLLRRIEGLLGRLPYRLSKTMARLFLLFNIRIVGRKDEEGQD